MKHIYQTPELEETLFDIHLLCSSTETDTTVDPVIIDDDPFNWN